MINWECETQPSLHPPPKNANVVTEPSPPLTFTLGPGDTGEACIASKVRATRKGANNSDYLKSVSFRRSKVTWYEYIGY